MTYDLLGRRVTAKQANKATEKKYIWGTYVDDLIAQVSISNDQTPVTSIQFAHSDRQYNVRGLTNNNGDIVELYAYSPYGEQTVLNATGTELNKTAYGNYYGYTGRYLDAETGLWYFRARYFDTAMGRFISRDPLGYIDGQSLYCGYFAQWQMLDPTGKQGIMNGKSKFVKNASPKGPTGYPATMYHVIKDCEITVMYGHHWVKNQKSGLQRVAHYNQTTSACRNAGTISVACNSHLLPNTVKGYKGHKGLLVHKSGIMAGGWRPFLMQMRSAQGKAQAQADAKKKPKGCCKTVAIKYKSFGKWKGGNYSQWDEVR